MHVDDLPGLQDTEFSTAVESQIPIVAERAMYFNYFFKGGGHDALGVKQLSDRW